MGVGVEQNKEEIIDRCISFFAFGCRLEDVNTTDTMLDFLSLMKEPGDGGSGVKHILKIKNVKLNYDISFYILGSFVLFVSCELHFSFIQLYWIFEDRI